MLESTRFKTKAGILQTTLETILDRSTLDLPLERLMNAITLVAWRCFAAFRGEIDVTDLVFECTALANAWRIHLYAIGHASSDPIQGAELLSDKDQCRHILRRGIFIPTGPDRFRFSHKEWEDFLVARYFAMCIKDQNFGEFENRAFTYYTFQSASEQLRDHTITEEAVQRALTLTIKRNNQFIIGNFTAFLGSSYGPIEPRALDMILSSLDQLPRVARYITLGIVCERALRAHPDDHSALLFRKRAIGLVDRYATSQDIIRYHPLLASYAWCWRRAFEKKFNISFLQAEWPGRMYTFDQDEAILDLVYQSRNDEMTRSQQRSLQIAFLQIQYHLLEVPIITNVAVHHLWPVVLSYVRGVCEPEISASLPHILSPMSAVTKAVRRYDLIPELKVIWERYQHICGITS